MTDYKFEGLKNKIIEEFKKSGVNKENYSHFKIILDKTIKNDPHK